MRLLLITLLFQASVVAAPYQRSGDYNDELKNSWVRLQHELGNQQAEIQTFDARLETIDATLEAIHTDIVALKQQQKDKSAAFSSDASSKLSSVDLSIKSVIIDIKTLKTQLSETSNTLNQFKNRFASLEKIVDTQNQNIDALQNAMRALTETFQVKDSGGRPTKSYVVKSGDALEKIARVHQMSVDEVKELNGLTHTKIIVGQKLLVYDKSDDSNSR